MVKMDGLLVVAALALIGLAAGQPKGPPSPPAPPPPPPLPVTKGQLDTARLAGISPGTVAPHWVDWPWAPAQRTMMMQRGQVYEMRSTIPHPVIYTSEGFASDIRDKLPADILRTGAILAFRWTGETGVRDFPFWLYGQKEIRPSRA